ncbi:hypothetical protein K449DRAFT_469979 [Hypoxylon sp. EC38]|nr:hypothetical protein K449DRAFT_469979 [Hypoxylon sp. EC38]
MASPLSHRSNEVSTSASSSHPVAGTIIGVILSFSACSVLFYFLGPYSIPFLQRTNERGQRTNSENSTEVACYKDMAASTIYRLAYVYVSHRLPLVLAIYIDSWIFVFGTGIINYGIGVDSNIGVCSAAILLCLFCYVTTKLIYIFLVEKAFIIGGGTKRRLESKLYIFNSFGILTLYGIVCTLSFVYRIARMDNGQCIIGIERPALVLLITFDILVNVYLTILFLSPLRDVYSFKGFPRTTPNSPKLHAVAMRTFVGALCTTTSSIVNLAVLMALNGELGWICLTCCNADNILGDHHKPSWSHSICALLHYPYSYTARPDSKPTLLFSAIVVQWVTSRDNAGTVNSFSPPSGTADKHQSYQPPPVPPPPAPSFQRNENLSISLPLKTRSTSQYEHIFGDPEPDIDVMSKSSTSACATASKPKPEYSAFDYDTDYDNIPITDNPEEETYSHRNGKGTNRNWTNTSTSTIPDTVAGARPQSLTPTSTSTPRKGRSSPSVSAADLERIRRYRGLRQHWSAASSSTATATAMQTTPTSPAPAVPKAVISRRSTRAPPRGYQISQLAFEGGESSRWYDLVGMEEEEEEEDGGQDYGSEMVDLEGWI